MVDIGAELWRSPAPVSIQNGGSMSDHKSGCRSSVDRPLAERLIARALARCDGRGLPVVVIGADGTVSAGTLDDEEAAMRALSYATLLLPPCAGGLTPAGLPDPESDDEVADVADDDWNRFMSPPDVGEDVRTATRNPSVRSRRWRHVSLIEFIPFGHRWTRSEPRRAFRRLTRLSRNAHLDE